jgi:hypothetical protein
MTKFQMATGEEQPVVSRVTCGSGRPWMEAVSDEEPPGYKEEEKPRAERLGVVRRDELADEDSDGSSDEEEGLQVQRMRYPVYPVYPEYVAPRPQVQVSDTVFRLSGRTTRTTKVLGIPVVKRIVEVTDSQDWKGH